MRGTFIYNTSLPSKVVHRVFWTWLVQILVFPSPTGCMVWSFSFFLYKCEIHSLVSSKMLSYFHEVLNFNRFVCNYIVNRSIFSSYCPLSTPMLVGFHFAMISRGSESQGCKKETQFFPVDALGFWFWCKNMILGNKTMILFQLLSYIFQLEVIIQVGKKSNFFGQCNVFYVLMQKNPISVNETMVLF